MMRTTMRLRMILCLTMIALTATACGKGDKKKDGDVTETEVDKGPSEAELMGLEEETWSTYKAAHAAVGAGEFDKALDGFQKVLEAKPDFAEAHYSLGLLFERRGKVAEAKASLEKARQADPEQTEYKVALGRMYAVVGEFDKAATMFQEVVARDPGNPQAKNNLAILALKKGDLDKAKEYVIEILVDDDRNVDALVTLGLIYKEQKKLEQAKFVFENKVIKLDKDSKDPKKIKDGTAPKVKVSAKTLADTYNNLGLIYMIENDTPKAVLSFEAANKTDSSYLPSRLNLGAILIEYLDYDRANAAFEQAVTIASDHCVANLGYAATQYATAKFKESAKHYTYYVEECDTKHIPSYERLAKLYESRLNQPAKAIEKYRQLVSLTQDKTKKDEHKAMIKFLENQMKTKKPKQPEPAAEGKDTDAPAQEEGGEEAPDGAKED